MPSSEDLKWLEEICKRQEAALSSLMRLIDDGVLVRDISHDNEDGWALRQLSLVTALKQAQQALAIGEK